MNGCRDIPRGFCGHSRHRGYGMAFLLVDRITEIDPGKRAWGQFVVPPDLRDPSHCLAVEAVEQLAPWAAMAKAAFRSRPVAGLAGEVKFEERVAPGTTLDLEVEIEGCESDAVLYDGWARVGPLLIVEMSRCVGSMPPMEDFEAPEAARARFELLCARKAPHQGFSFHASVSPRVVLIDHDPGKRVRAARKLSGSFSGAAVSPRQKGSFRSVRMEMDLRAPSPWPSMRRGWIPLTLA